MPFTLVKCLQEAEAIFPLRGQEIPDEAERVQLLPPVGRQRIFAFALITDPLSQSKALLAMERGYTAMPFALVKARQKIEALYPLRSQDIPHKAECIEPLAALRQYGLFVCALIVDLLP